MPELPEVETIRRVLEPQLQGRVIQSVTVSRPEIIAHPGADEFCRALRGREIARMERRGKFLIIQLTPADRLVLHLRMTGCLLLTPADAPREKHTHLVCGLDDSRELRFTDVRRFGRFWLFRAGEDDACSGLRKLGMEPFDADFSADVLRGSWQKCKKAIKECLLDQRVVAGIGNIYADEILFAAGIHPARPACSLSAGEWERLAALIPERLAYYIEKNAISPEDYLKGRGRDYRNTPFLRIYGHSGEACPVCGALLCRTAVGGRNSVYCPACQQQKV